MLKTISSNEFCLLMVGTFGKFTVGGSRALFEYLEETEGSPYLLDPIALASQWTEYRNLEEVKEEYDCIESLEDLEDRTQVLKIPDGYGLVIREF